MAAADDTPPDYAWVELPDPETVPYPEWSTEQRRAALIRACRRAGGPNRLNKAEFARRFDVDRSVVYREDLDAISASLAHHAGGVEVLMTELRAAFEKCYNDLLDQGKPKEGVGGSDGLGGLPRLSRRGTGRRYSADALRSRALESGDRDGELPAAGPERPEGRRHPRGVPGRGGSDFRRTRTWARGTARLAS